MTWQDLLSRVAAAISRILGTKDNNMTPTLLFAMKAPGVMRRLLADFPTLSVVDAAAIVGNLGHESNGFATLQEISPTVPGSAGGYGWAQWTGSRRRDYVAYCAKHGMNPANDDANYAFLRYELSSTEARSIRSVSAASGLTAKVKAFEAAYLRAGVKGYPSRIAWAQRALDAWNEGKA